MADMNHGSVGPNPVKTNTGLIIALIVIVLIIGALALFRNAREDSNQMANDGNTVMNEENLNTEEQMGNSLNESNSMDENTEANGTNETNATTDTEANEVAEADVKVFTLTSENFTFSMDQIKVKKGDKVKIVLDNKVGMHDLVIDEYDARTKVLNGAGTDSIEFTADKTGEFEYYCSVGKHREMGMKGTLIVE